MSVYSPQQEEALRARRLLKEWAGDGLLTGEQYERLEQDTVCELRTTNIYLRVALFLFTSIGVAASVLFFFWIVFPRSSQQNASIWYLVFAAICYVAAETIVSQQSLYRHGIEEALAVCSVGFLCWGLEGVFFRSHAYSSMYTSHPFAFLVPAAGVAASLCIWRRFGLWYAFPAAMIFAASLPEYWTGSRAGQHAILAALYAVGLVLVTRRSLRDRSDSLRNAYSQAEALLWVGLYLAINLKVSTLNPRWLWWTGPALADAGIGRPFYWATWVLIWCVPPFVLTRGIRRKDRFVMAAGAIAAILTLVSSKPYLGWQRHTWDPMLMGILLTGVALWLRRWLASGPDGVRHGFTARRLSGRDKAWVESASGVLGLMSPQFLAPEAQSTSTDFQFGGGGSGGGGASGDF